MQSEPKPESEPQQPETQDKKGQKKGDKKEKKEHKSEYVFDADLVTVDTQLPALPKKSELIKKPEFDEFKEKQKKNREKIQKLIEQKKQIRQENFKPNRNAKKGGEGGKFGEFSQQVDEVKELRERFNDLKKERNEKRDKLHALIEEAKAVNATIKELGGASHSSRESVLERLEVLEQRLMTDSLSKEEEKSLNGEITALKRKIKDAVSSENIEQRLEKAYERREKLDLEIEQVKEEKEPLESECNEVFGLLEKKNAAIDGLKKELDSENKERTEQRESNSKEWESWKENKKKRLDEAEARIQKLHQENDRLWEEFNARKEEYWKQKHFVDWVEWQMKVRTRKLNEQERERKRLLYEQKDREREKEEQLQKYIAEIELCNVLVSYLQGLRQQDTHSTPAQRAQEKKEAADISQQMAASDQWKGEKGLQVIKSKKEREDEEAPRKVKKGKRKQNSEKEEGPKPFQIPYHVQNQFETLKILAPSSLEEIDKKIEELRDREKLFERGCQQEEEVSEDDKKMLDEIKNRKSGQRTAKTAASKAEEDFPTI